MEHYRLRILHLSDLHERGSDREREAWRRRRVLGTAWERNLDELRQDGPIDLVCFTGDAADWGRAEEYTALTDFFQAVLTRLNVEPSRFFPVPGNHDIQRPVQKEVWDKLRQNLHQVNAQDVSRWLAGGPTPWGFRDDDRAALLERQGAYRHWLTTTLQRPDLLPNPTLHPHLGYRQTLQLPGQPFSINIIGFDSAWLAGDDHDSGNLRLTEDQVMRLCGDGEPLPGFRLALVHHPLDDLADAASCRRLLADNVDLLLRGHLHEPEPALWADPERSLRQLAAGCLYEGHRADLWPNACHLLDVVLDKQGRPLRYELRFRGWSGRGHWFDDNSLYRDSRNGRLTICLHAEPPLQIHPKVEDVFVGRAEELSRLHATLLPVQGAARPVGICSLQGMAGVGKSYLVDRFYRQYAAQFPGGYQRLVLSTRPRSYASLRDELLEALQLSPAQADLLPSRLQNPYTLLHIENVDTRELAVPVAELVAKLPGCPVAVTGRYRGVGSSAGWEQITVQPFDEGTALQQLRQELERPTDSAEDRRLVRALGYLPLAIHLAAGHLRAGRSVQWFLRELQKRGLNIEPLDPADPALQQDRSRAILATTFALSLDWLAQAFGAEAERLLAAFAALGHGPAAGFGRGVGAALAGVEPDEFADELAFHAVQLSLLERLPTNDPDQSRWRLHPLLAELLRQRTDEAAALERLGAWFLARLPLRPAGEEQEQGRCWQAVNQEQDALVHWLMRLPMEQGIQAERAGSWYAILNGPFHVWLEFCERLLASNLDDEARSNCLWTLGQVARRAGLLERALTAARDKASVDEARSEEREAALARGLEADVLEARGDLDEALRIRREEELPVFERLGDVRERAVTLGRIADVLQARGDLDEALRIRREEELPVYERLGDVRSRAVTLGKIADVLQARGDLDEALRIRREEELPVYERLGDVRLRAVTLGKIADVLQARGDLDEALRIRREEQLPVFERLGAVRSRAVTLGKIADVLEARGDLDEALRIRREEQLPVYERLGDVRERAVTLGKIADVLEARGDLDEALRIRREEELPVYEHLRSARDIMICRAEIGSTQLRRGEREQAALHLCFALGEARRMQLPEADIIQRHLDQAGLSCNP